MGGAKKPTTAKKDTSSSSKDSKKGKKDKGEGGPKKAEITVMVNEQQAMKILQNAKVITVQEMARQTGVKISAANKFLRESAEKPPNTMLCIAPTLAQASIAIASSGTIPI